MSSTGVKIGTLTVVRFTGKDRVRVYNNLCTQDLRNATSGKCAETFVTDVKGKTYGHGMAAYFDDEALFVGAPGYAERLVPHFDRYIIREDAKVVDASQEFDAWLFPSAKLIEQLFTANGQSIPAPGNATKFSIQEHELIAMSVEWMGPDSLLVLTRKNTTDAEPAQINPISIELEQHSSVSDTATRDAWERDRIEAFFPWYGVDFDEKNLPQELSRDTKAISFNKGCYLGQETIARLDALGQVQKKLVLLQFTGSSVDASIANAESESQLEIVGSELPFVLPAIVTADDKEVGTLTSYAPNADGTGGLGLAMVKRSHFQVGQSVSVGTIRATVLR